MIEDPTKSYHANQRVTENDLFDNRFIFGDNLLALKALEQEFFGKIKCIFIDPPYNTGSAFTYYDDGVEHSIWLSLMRDRLELLHRLLSEDGSLWITIDDNESHYLNDLALPCRAETAPSPNALLGPSVSVLPACATSANARQTTLLHFGHPTQPRDGLSRAPFA